MTDPAPVEPVPAALPQSSAPSGWRRLGSFVGPAISLGILGGGLWCAAGRHSHAALRTALWLLSLACALGPPLAWWSRISWVQRQARLLFPLLVDDSHLYLHPLWRLESTPALAHTAPLLLSRDSTHPASIHLDALERDWSGYAGLEITGTLTAKAAVEIGVRVDLAESPARRLRAGGWIQPGTSQIQIFWPPGSATPRVHQLVVFLDAGPSAAQLQIRQLRLIPGTKKTRSAGLQDTGTTQ